MQLSIIVITHNQREQLRRCIDSVLAQQIPFEYEVLISDDASTDGSFELAQEYERLYCQVHAYSCNSDDFNPSNKSFRSGINRCNALKHANGKYIAHIDGDDFLLKNSRIYEKQVNLLEQFPDCSCCMANDYEMVDGEDESTIRIRHQETFDTGHVLKKEDYIRNYFRESPCFVYRRNSLVDPAKVLDGFYADNCITTFYLQFGDIVCLKDAGYVYVQYEQSIWHDYLNTNDHIVLSCPALFCAGLMPIWKPVYWSNPRDLAKIKDVVSSALKGVRMTKMTQKWMYGFDYYIFHAFNRPLTIMDKLHLYVLWLLLGVMRRMKRKHPLLPQPWRLLDKLL